MAELMIGVNGNVIKWAREFLNISLEEATKSLHVTFEKYSAFEDGTDFPTYPKLKEISNLFKKPIGIFFLNEPPNIDIKADLRSLSESVKEGLSKKILLSLEKAKFYQENLKELYENRDCEFFKYKYNTENINELAVQVRKIIRFPLSVQKERKYAKVLLELLREKMYDLGIYIFKDSFGDDTVSGLCIYDENYPVIMLNNKMSFTRQVFTLFHEIYHLIKKISGIEIMEDDFMLNLQEDQKDLESKCDQFANEFLIPTDDFKEVIKQFEINELTENGYITPSDYYSYKQKMGLSDIRGRESKKTGGNPYYTKLSYLGQQYTKEIFTQLFTGRIDKFKASEFLGAKVDHLATFETMIYRGGV